MSPSLMTPRRAIVALARVVATMAASVALLPAALAAQGSSAVQPIDRRLPLNADGLVKIFNYAGAVRLVGWARDTVAVTGTIRARQQFFMGGSATGIKLGVEGETGIGAELTVSVPTGARVWIRTSTGDVDVRAFTGSLDVGTVQGRVRVQAQPSELTVESMAGDIDVSSSPRYLRVRSASGTVLWNGSSEDAAITTVGGAITVRAGVVTHARLESVSGTVQYTGGVVRGGRLELDSHGGDVSAALSRNAVADLEVDAPESSVLGVRTTRPALDARRAQVIKTLAREGVAGAQVVLRSFKGRATITQP